MIEKSVLMCYNIKYGALLRTDTAAVIQLPYINKENHKYSEDDLTAYFYIFR